MRKPVNAQPVAQALLGLTAQFRALIAFRVRRIAARPNREPRQDRLARNGTERAALGDLDGGGQRLRHIGEQHGHFSARLETMIRRELIALGLGDHTSPGDT